jgi:hypothetical protein
VPDRLAAEKGEGSILDVYEDMPNLQAASTLPDASVVARDVRVWSREFEQLRAELATEGGELRGYEQAREERREARRRAAEEARRKEVGTRESRRLQDIHGVPLVVMH